MINKKLKLIFSKVLKVSQEDINNQTSPNNCSNWDSFSMLILVIEIEEKFNIKLDIDEVVSIKNFGDVLNLIEQKTA